MIKKVMKDRIVWKRAIGAPSNPYSYNRLEVVVKMLLPKGASYHRDSFSKKCRASRAKVLVFYQVRSCDEILSNIKVVSCNDSTFQYKIGEVVKPKRRFSKLHETCASGIHFFSKRSEAEDYNFL